MRKWKVSLSKTDPVQYATFPGKPKVSIKAKAIISQKEVTAISSMLREAAGKNKGLNAVTHLESDDGLSVICWEILNRNNTAQLRREEDYFIIMMEEEFQNGWDLDEEEEEK